MNRKTKRITALLLAVTAAAAPLSVWSSVPVSAAAKTIEQINQEKKEKQEQINRKKEQLAALSDDLSKKAQYEQTLNEQIGLITDKLTLIDSQLQDLHVNMEDTEQKIVGLENQIAEQKEQVAKDMDLFKKRIRTLYVHGNDGILSALVGARSFYDILSRIDIIKRITKHDNDIIERLRSEIRELSKSEQELTDSLQTLNIQETEINVLCDEFKASQEELNQASAKNSSEMQSIRGQQNEVQGQINSYEQMIEKLDAEQEKLIAEAIAKAEAERKAKEEADRKAQKEAERKDAEEAQRQAASTQAPVSQQQSQTTVTTAKPVSPASTAAPVTTKAPVTAAPQTTPASTTTAAPQQSSSKLQWPAPGHYHISSPYGYRTLDGVGGFHSGIDISDGGINGTAACAAASGTVLMHGPQFCTHNYKKTNNNCGCNGGYGNYLILDHGNGIYTLYAHLASISVADGQSVTVGQQVGVIGTTGHSTGPHLHFEVRVGGSAFSNHVNPMNYLP